MIFMTSNTETKFLIPTLQGERRNSEKKPTLIGHLLIFTKIVNWAIWGLINFLIKYILYGNKVKLMAVYFV